MTIRTSIIVISARKAFPSPTFVELLFPHAEDEADPTRVGAVQLAPGHHVHARAHQLGVDLCRVEKRRESEREREIDVDERGGEIERERERCSH